MALYFIIYILGARGILFEVKANVALVPKALRTASVMPSWTVD